IFGDVRAEKFFGFKSGGKEVHVIHKRVGNACRCKSSGKLRLPNALGKPRSQRTPPKMPFEIGGKSRELFELILRRDGDKDRLVEATADELHLAGLRQFFQAVKILGAMLLDPCQKRPGIVKADVNAGIFLEMFEKRKIRIVVRFFKHMLEVAAGLV